MQTEFWQAYLISAAIGILVGIEREKAASGGKTMGVRTFLLISLLGALAGGLDQLWLSGVIAAFCFSLIVVSYFKSAQSGAQREHLGVTTEFAAAIVFCLSFISHSRPVLAIVMGPVVAIVLYSKASLHRFTARVKPSELQAAILILLLGVLVLNVLEDKVVDPWGIFNPRKFGLLVLTLAGLEFASYVLTKMMSETKSTLVIGFLGGLVSSTAVLISSAKKAKSDETSRAHALGSAVAAKLASLTMLVFIVGMVSVALLQAIALPLGLCILAGAVALALILWRHPEGGAGVEVRSPLEWRGVLRLALLLGAILAAVALAKKFFGEAGTLALSFLTGMFELHGVSLATSTMFARGQLSEGAAFESILLAATASLVAKIAIAWIVERGRFAQILTLIFTLMTAVLWSSTFLL